MPSDRPGPPLTLAGFLEDAGARLHFYDMGRRVRPIPYAQFQAFETTAETYPYPMQQKAWFALVQEHPQALSEPLIWFLHFDLDEQGKLIQATRDYLIHRFVEIASDRPTPADLGQAMRDNPYAFAPGEDKMANLHARVHHDLGLAPSQYYTHARDYLRGEPGWEQWRFVAYQGLADIAARLDENQNTAIVSMAIPQLPNEPLVAMCQCLEHHVPGKQLANALYERQQQAITDSNTPPAVLAALLRGLSLAETGLVASSIMLLLGDKRSSDPEILAAIGGRAWEALRNPKVARAYLERLASPEVGQDIFNHCLTDLLHMPDLQAPMLDVLRAPDRSGQLARAFEKMLQG